MSGRHSFTGVDVGLPSKVRGSEAEEEWQEVDWVTWSTGELTVDGESFLLVFKPSGGGTVKAKPLGSLLRASPVSVCDEEERTMVVTTSDSLHRLLRFTFPSRQQASEFSRLAVAAEAAASATAGSQDCRASLAEVDAKLEAAIREKYIQLFPLIFAGVEFYGPGPNAEAGGEVLLGRGAVVLLDPPEDCKSVGCYEILLFGDDDEGASKPVRRLKIGPKMALTKQGPEANSEDEGDVSAAQFLLCDQTMPAHTLCFEDADVAARFARDFRVRQRLMEMSLRTVKRGHAADALRSEIDGLKQQSLLARLRRLVCFCIILLIFIVGVRVAVLYAKDKGTRHPTRYLTQVQREAQVGMRLSWSAALASGSKACKAAFGMIPAEDVRRCIAVADSTTSVSRITHCLETLAGAGLQP